MVKSNSSGPRHVRDVVEIPKAVLEQARKSAFELYNAGRLEQAETMIKGVLAVDEKDAWSQALLGSIWRQQRRFRDSLRLMESALVLDPENDNIRTMRDELAALVSQRQQGTPAPEGF